MPNARPGYSDLRIEAPEIKPAVLAHPEFVAYTGRVNTILSAWKADHIALLKGIDVGTRPRLLIEILSETFLLAFADLRLVDPYDVYQHLMAYWADTMQDDVYLIASDGWLGSSKLRLLEPKSEEKTDLTIGRLKYKADLVPPPLIIARYFASEQQAIDALQTQSEALAGQMDEMIEEHGGEDGLLQEAINDKGKVTKGNLNTRIKEIKNDPDFADERDVLNAYRALMDQESAIKTKINKAQAALDALAVARYAALTEDEVKTLVVDDKWLAALTAAVQTELDRISQALTGRVTQLVERYATPLPELSEALDASSTKVDEHLKRMGFA